MMVGLSGCRPEKPIEVSTYEKPDDLMLVGISVRGQSAWTIKLVGKRADVLKLEEPVIQFAQSFDFSEDPENPDWQVPSGWTKLDIKRLGRKATFSIPTSKVDATLELVVSQLGIPRDSLLNQASTDEYIADNINRWRKQMGLQPVIHYTVNNNNREVGLRVADLMLPLMKQVDVDGRVMYFEKIEGQKPESAGPPMMAGMSGKMPGMNMPHGSGSGAQTQSGKKSAEPPSIPDLPFDFTAPESWRLLEPNSVAILRYGAGPESNQGVISVSKFPASAVTWNQTVAMWQGQLKLKKSNDDEVAKMTESIDIESGQAKLAKLIGGEASQGQSITGVMLKAGDDHWFVKLQGKSEIVEQEMMNFESFVKSIKFRSGDGK